MRYAVVLTADAVRDLEEIIDWIAAHDGPARAKTILARLEAVTASLARFPDRGPCPPELLALGIREYRQTSFKPYRIVYRMTDKHVHVVLVADGRRDMQTLLVRRLLEA
jgi:toxin ParE1/3/4